MVYIDSMIDQELTSIILAIPCSIKQTSLINTINMVNICSKQYKKHLFLTHHPTFFKPFQVCLPYMHNTMEFNLKNRPH